MSTQGISLDKLCQSEIKTTTCASALCRTNSQSLFVQAFDSDLVIIDCGSLPFIKIILIEQKYATNAWKIEIKILDEIPLL
ncbi:hypothetical protein DOY81_003245 [Sarcophaga bullata]|nr:hypothetical protein DOY81_003245 [Sarcophaga bullata]